MPKVFWVLFIGLARLLPRLGLKASTCLALIASLLLAPHWAQAAPQTSRQQALKSLTSPDPDKRGEAIVLLAKVGQMQDTDALVDRLKDADEGVAEAASMALWLVWSRAGDKAIDKLYARGTSEMATGKLPEAIATFTQIIKAKPSFAEAWNKRATVYFSMGELKKSLADCDEVIKRNPKHFGALSGYGQIYIQMGELEKALIYFEKAYDVNPTMQGVGRNIEHLREAIERKRAKTI